MFRSLTIGLAALGFGIVAPLAAMAYPAHTTTSLNVRTGPGVSYHRIGVLPPRAVVNVRRCHARWCAIDFRGRHAWVSRSYLRRGGHVGPRYVPAPPAYYPPYYPYRYRPRSGVTIYFGTGPVPWWWR